MVRKLNSKDKKCCSTLLVCKLFVKRCTHGTRMRQSAAHLASLWASPLLPVEINKGHRRLLVLLLHCACVVVVVGAMASRLLSKSHHALQEEKKVSSAGSDDSAKSCDTSDADNSRPHMDKSRYLTSPECLPRRLFGVLIVTGGSNFTAEPPVDTSAGTLCRSPSQ